VLIDGAAVRSCITRAASVGTKEITTIEGLEKNGKLHPVQEAFLAKDALQCAYCTPGMILGSVALLKKNAHPSAAEISAALDGHMCRCGTYPRIVEAVRMAASSNGRGAR
jgi:aerobic-type carbon monoxide dehydrogenase small subunit (CoxS/CutS family)